MTTNFTAKRQSTDKIIDQLPLEQIVRKYFPDLTDLRKCDDPLDKAGADYSAHFADDRSAGLDFKLRSVDPMIWGLNDLAVEIWSSIEHKITGYKGTKTDYIIWVYPTTGRTVMAPFRPFRRRVAETRNTLIRALPQRTQATKGKAGNIYHSQHCYAPTWMFPGLITEARFNPIRAFKK